MLDLILLVLFLILVFRVVASGLTQSPGSEAAMGDHGNVITINKREEFDAKLEEAANAKKTIVVDFTATWCGPCRHIAPIYVEFSKKHTDIIFLKVDVDAFQDIAAEWGVEAMPTFVFIKDKKLAHKTVGANKEEVEKQIVFFSASHATA